MIAADEEVVVIPAEATAVQCDFWIGVEMINDRQCEREATWIVWLSCGCIPFACDEHEAWSRSSGTLPCHDHEGGADYPRPSKFTRSERL